MGLDTVEFILWSEQEFEIEIPDEDAQQLLTVGQFAAYVHQQLLDTQGSMATAEAEIFERIETFLVSTFKISPDKISRDSNFIKDLRLDQ